jgi:hypothetical protein
MTPVPIQPSRVAGEMTMGVLIWVMDSPIPGSAVDVNRVAPCCRSSLLLDDEGKVIQTWYKVSPEDTVAKAEEALGRSKG